MKEDTRPLMVSIRCITYNHEPYIRQCLEGFVMQKTNFRFEAIVHDDASTDGTAAIIREYAEKYPDIIKPIIETENQWSKHDGSLDYIMDEACTGKYIALCEGDDYWTDPNKLQKQVSFLELHPEYTMCCHNSNKLLVQENKYIQFSPYNKDQDITAYIAIHQWVIATASMVFRREMNDVPQWETKIYSGDYSLILRCLYHGKIFYFHDIMSVYRFNMTGSSMTAMVQENPFFLFEQHIKLLTSYYNAPNQKYKKVIKWRIVYLKNEILFNKYRHSKDLTGLVYYLISGVKKLVYNKLYPFLL